MAVFGQTEWTRGKSCDTFGPTGPWLTTQEQIADPHSLDLETLVNGEMWQRSSTGDMIFSIPFLLSFISTSITLEPVDIIATGTPPGVGVFRDPPVFLKPGDVIEMRIKGLGFLRNEVRIDQ